MLRGLALVVLCGCGRVAFDPLGAGHDEDGDGVADREDVCPHVAGSQADGDQDGVGDDCDPNPTVARDAISLFATMMAADQPFVTRGDGIWVQREDSLAFTGAPDLDGYLYGGLRMEQVSQDVRVAVGLDIVDRFDGTPQNQFALAVQSNAPIQYVELNESPVAAVATVTLFDGQDYVQQAPTPLLGGVHRGSLFFQGTFVVGDGVRFDAGWLGEAYVSEVMDAVYQGGDELQINLNNLLVEIRWLVVITSS